MKKITLFIILATLNVVKIFAQNTINIIPQPVSCTVNQGSFTINANTVLVYNKTNDSLALAAQFLKQAITQISGITLKTNTASTATNIISININKQKSINNEGYELNCTTNGIYITANSYAGVLYGIQSLLQMLPAVRTNATLQVPCTSIKDYPRFAWRGLHLDVSRHFFSADIIKQYIDLMARYKLNVFHWHLVDDQGWRIEIKKYPLLTQIGAWRVNKNQTIWGSREQAKPNEQANYGGYYTQQQIKEIINYAAKLNITIVPEIEMPGHVASAIAAYPFLSCTQQKQLPLTGGNYTNMSSNYCVGNDSVLAFNQAVLSEVINLFPSKYIHIGGDEVDKTAWKKCNKCQQCIKNNGLKNEEELQSFFIKKIEKFILSKGRKLMGWDEILEGGLAPQAAVMSWRGEDGGIAAAKMKHPVVMTPGNPLYFDHYQGDPATEPTAIGGFNTLKRVYNYNPIPKDLQNADSNFVLGAQANVWTEYITNTQQLQYMILPRMLALAEVAWTPLANKDFSNFYTRLQPHIEMFEQKGLNYSKGNTKVDISPNIINGQLLVNLQAELPNTDIYYTTNGSMPTLQSTKYNHQPIAIQTSGELKAVIANQATVLSKTPSVQAFAIHKAIGKTVSYLYPVSKYYTAEGDNTLVNGIKGVKNVGKHWHGFAGKDLVATINLQKPETITSISLGCLQNYNDWIFMPSYVQIETSTNGIDFTTIATIKNDISVNEKSFTLKDFKANFNAVTAQYIKVTAKNLGTCPKGHNGEGKEAWLFVDEISVE